MDVHKQALFRPIGEKPRLISRPQIDKYTWQYLGSSYLPSELCAVYLWAQLEMADTITKKRLALWNQYSQGLYSLVAEGFIELPILPEDCTHNGHMFFIKTRDISERTALISNLKKNDIMAVFHYVPLHSSPAGLRFGRMSGKDQYTTIESERLLRLPLYFALESEKIDLIITVISNFYRN